MNLPTASKKRREEVVSSFFSRRVRCSLHKAETSARAYFYLSNTPPLKGATPLILISVFGARVLLRQNARHQYPLHCPISLLFSLYVIHSRHIRESKLHALLTVLELRVCAPAHPGTSRTVDDNNNNNGNGFSFNILPQSIVSFFLGSYSCPPCYPFLSLLVYILMKLSYSSRQHHLHLNGLLLRHHPLLFFHNAKLSPL